MSRKDFVGETLGVELTARLEGTLAATALAAADAGAIASSGSIAGHMALARIFPGVALHQYHVNADTKIRVSADGGYSWADDHTDAGAAIYDIDSTDDALAAVATEGGAAKVIAELASLNRCARPAFIAKAIDIGKASSATFSPAMRSARKVGPKV